MIARPGLDRDGGLAAANDVFGFGAYSAESSLSERCDVTGGR
jgi:hypothetical protein